MKILNILKISLILVALPTFGSEMINQSSDPRESGWVCEGYCFLGGDVPTNPFQPVSSTGATEQEARDNIDCGAYTETGIVCRKVEDSKGIAE